MNTDIKDIVECAIVLQDITRYNWTPLYNKEQFYLERSNYVVIILNDNNIEYKIEDGIIFINFSEIRSWIRNKKLNEILNG